MGCGPPHSILNINTGDTVFRHLIEIRTPEVLSGFCSHTGFTLQLEPDGTTLLAKLGSST